MKDKARSENVRRDAEDGNSLKEAEQVEFGMTNPVHVYYQPRPTPAPAPARFPVTSLRPSLTRSASLNLFPCFRVCSENLRSFDCRHHLGRQRTNGRVVH